MKIYNPLFALLLSAFVGEVLAAAIPRGDGPANGNGVTNGQSKQNVDDGPTGSGVYVYDDEDWNPYRHYGLHGGTGGKDWEHDHIIETHHTEQSDDDGKNKSHYVSDKKTEQDRSNGVNPNGDQGKGNQGGDSGKTPPTNNQGSVNNGKDDQKAKEKTPPADQKAKEKPPPADQKTEKAQPPADQKVSDTKPPPDQKVNDSKKVDNTQPPTGNTQTPPPNTQQAKEAKAPVDTKAKDPPAPVDQNVKPPVNENAKGTPPPPPVEQNAKAAQPPANPPVNGAQPPADKAGSVSTNRSGTS